MKTKTLLLLNVAFIIGFSACKSKMAETQSFSTVDNSRSSLNWAGTYSGVIPCAYCSGIEMRVTLNQDGTYALSQRYEDRAGVFEEKGNIRWDASGNTVLLSDLTNKSTFRFKVGENQITMLDREGKDIKGTSANNYILTKVNPELVGKKWKLTELAGEKVDSQQSAFILLDAVSNSVSGNLNCNNFTGFYDLKIGNRITFTNLAVTQKMCLNMSVENELKKALEMADSYSITDHKLILNHARMAPLAVFVPY